MCLLIEAGTVEHIQVEVKALANEDTLLRKHFLSATNVSQFVQHGNTTFILCPARLRAQETS